MDAEGSSASSSVPVSISTDWHGTAGSLHDAQGTVALSSDHINEWDNKRAMRHYLEHQTRMVQKEHSEKIQEHLERFEPIPGVHIEKTDRRGQYYVRFSTRSVRCRIGTCLRFAKSADGEDDTMEPTYGSTRVVQYRSNGFIVKYDPQKWHTPLCTDETWWLHVHFEINTEEL